MKLAHKRRKGKKAGTPDSFIERSKIEGQNRKTSPFAQNQ